MSRKVIVMVSPSGEISVEAEGFQGKGCEAATKAIEDALGERTSKTIKREYHRHPVVDRQIQKLGGDS